MLVISAPIYIIRETDDDGDDALSTHSTTYSWFWTFAYLRGVVPSCLIMISWASTVAVCFYCIILTPLIEQTPAISMLSKSESKEVPKSGTPGIVMAYCLISGVLLLNAAVTISVNTLYIYSTQQPLSALTRFVMQLGLAVFRLVYSYIALPILSRTIIDPVANIGFRLRLLIVNNLVIPCLVTAFASPSCFQVSLPPEVLSCCHMSLL